MNKRLLVFGSGVFAELAQHYFDGGGEYRVAAFAVDAGFVAQGVFCGLPVLAWEEAVRAFPCETTEMFIGIGYSRRNRLRKEKYLLAQRAGYRLASYVHPSASIAGNARLGDNCFVREQGIVAPFACVGSNVSIGSRVCVSHHVLIGDHCYLGPGAVVCGLTSVGEACLVGANATLGDKLNVGAGCVIGGGAVVLADCEPGGVYRAALARRSGSRYSRLPKS